MSISGTQLVAVLETKFLDEWQKDKEEPGAAAGFIIIGSRSSMLPL